MKGCRIEEAEEEAAKGAKKSISPHIPLGDMGPYPQGGI